MRSRKPVFLDNKTTSAVRSDRQGLREGKLGRKMCDEAGRIHCVSSVVQTSVLWRVKTGDDNDSEVEQLNRYRSA